MSNGEWEGTGKGRRRMGEKGWEKGKGPSEIEEGVKG